MTTARIESMDSAAMSMKQLGDSLCTRAHSLDVQRKDVYAFCIDASIDATEKYEKFQAMKDSYVLTENDFRMELEMFWDLLNRTEDMLKNEALTAKSDAVTSQVMETASNHDESTSNSLSPIEEVAASAYSQDESHETETDNVSTVDIVVVSAKSECLEFGVPEPAQQMMKRQSVDLSIAPASGSKPELKSEPEVVSAVESVAENKEIGASPNSARPTPEAVRSVDPKSYLGVNVKVTSTISAGVKTSDNGFALWKRNKGQRMYTSTELYCTKTFGGDTKKLRRYLVAKGGFGDDEIKSIRVFQVQDRERQKMVHHARVVVNGKTNAIEDKIEALEKSRGKKRWNVIWISSMKRNERSNKLMVRNFDILSGNDRRRMTQMFSRFGALDGGIKIGRNGDGINFAIVTFRDVEDARICERTQNDSWFRQDMLRDELCFNGRRLQIGYADNVNVQYNRNNNSRKTQRKNRKGRW